MDGLDAVLLAPIFAQPYAVGSVLVYVRFESVLLWDDVAEANHRECDAANLLDAEKRQVFNDVIQGEPPLGEGVYDPVGFLVEVIKIIGVLLRVNRGIW